MRVNTNNIKGSLIITHFFTVPIPPGCSIRVTLKQTGHKFRLWRESTDKTDYQLILTNCTLHVPVQEMSVGFYDSFLHSWNAKPINFYYLRPQIKVLIL